MDQQVKPAALSWPIQALKVVGIIVLIWHLSVSEEVLEPLWIIYCAVIYLFTVFLVSEIVRRIARCLGVRKRNSDDISRLVLKHPWVLLLVPGEDGLFLVPLLYIGITPLNAAILAAIFSALHVRIYGVLDSVPKFFGTLVVMLVCLKYGGLLACVASHFLIDLCIVIAIYWESRKSNNTEVDRSR